MMLGDADELSWVLVDERSSVGAARRLVVERCAQLGLDETRTAEVAVAVTELASNIAIHASSGTLGVRSSEGGGGRIDVIAIDAGPGIADVAAAFTDGTSSRGTLGVGLGAVRRLADHLDVYSVPGRGSIFHAVFANGDVAPTASRIDGLTRAITGEQTCGDAWAGAERPRRIAALLTDGLGHGELAARASRIAVQSFSTDPWRGPAAQIDAAHRQMGASRGAAVFAVDVDLDARTLRYAGVGNVAGRILGGERDLGLLSQPGIVGHHMGTVRETTVEVEPRTVAVLHSDGLTSKWTVSRSPGLESQTPTIVGASLMRDAAIRHDDASVVVIRLDPSIESDRW